MSEKLDQKFIEYFRKKYSWTKDAPVQNFPWYAPEWEIWKDCKKAYGVK